MEAQADRVVAAVLGPAGRSDPELRRRALERAQAITRGEQVTADGHDALLELVDTIARNAYRVTDEQVSALRAAGHSEDELFDVTVAAAVGAGVARRALGLEAIASWEAGSARS